jgi:hypothetical protein
MCNCNLLIETRNCTRSNANQVPTPKLTIEPIRTTEGSKEEKNTTISNNNTKSGGWMYTAGEFHDHAALTFLHPRLNPYPS